MSVTGSPPVRYPSGFSSSAPGFAMGNYPHMTPPRINEYFNDFNTYAAGDWTVTAVGGGTSALSDANGGKLVVTSGASLNDIQGNQLTKKTFAFTTGSQVWFSINVSIADATNSAFMAGLGSSFTALTPTDGVYFSKAAASAVMTAVVRASSTSTTMTVGTMVDATAYTFSFYYDGLPTPSLYFFSTIGATAPTSQSVPYFTGGNTVNALASSVTGSTNSLANIPPTTTLLTAGFALKAGTTAAQVGTIDYFLAGEEIVNRF